MADLRYWPTAAKPGPLLSRDRQEQVVLVWTVFPCAAYGQYHSVQCGICSSSVSAPDLNRRQGKIRYKCSVSPPFCRPVIRKQTETLAGCLPILSVLSYDNDTTRPFPTDGLIRDFSNLNAHQLLTWKILRCRGTSVSQQQYKESACLPAPKERHRKKTLSARKSPTGFPFRWASVDSKNCKTLFELYASWPQ